MVLRNRAYRWFYPALASRVVTVGMLAAIASLMASRPAHAQADVTAQARQVFADVNRQLSRFDAVTFVGRRPGVGYKAEGRAWAEAGLLRKIEVTERDDSGDVVSEFFFAGPDLVFLFESVRGFADSGSAKRQVTTSEERFYFRDGALVKWISGMGNDKRDNASGSADFNAAGRSRLAAAAAFKLAAQRAMPAPVPETGRAPDKAGSVGKASVARVVEINPGDVACYLSLTDDHGKRFEEMADFAICEKPAQYLGKRFGLSYGQAVVMADECQGNPTCKKTKQVAIVKALTPLAARDGVAAVAPAGSVSASKGQLSFCTPRETIVFSCRTASRMVSVCAAGDATRTRGYLQYRFGKPDSAEPLELILPEGEQIANRAASGESVPLAGGGSSWLRFRKGSHSYVTYSGVGRWGPGGQTAFKQGVVVERDGKTIANLKCAQEPLGELGPQWFEKFGVTRKGTEEFDMPD